MDRRNEFGAEWIESPETLGTNAMPRCFGGGNIKPPEWTPDC